MNGTIPRNNEQDPIAALFQLRRKNNDVRAMIAQYLTEHPRLINRTIMESMNTGTGASEESLFCSLLAAACDLDLDSCDWDRILFRDYFQPAVQQLSVATCQSDSYFQNIKIPELSVADWQLKYETYEPYEAFVAGDLRVLPDLREIPQIGFFNEEFRFPVLTQAGHEWMAVKPSEMTTMRPILNTIHGNIVTFGLGLGYFVYHAALKDNVTGITVVERDPNVIQLFEKTILPQIPQRHKITIVGDDAFDFLANPQNFTPFQDSFFDLWHDASDGLELYLKIRKFESANRGTRFLYWIEETLLSALRWQIFDAVVEHAESYDEIVQYLQSSNLRKRN